MAHLTSLPPELVLAVASYIKAQGASLAPFAAISIQFQASIENITFRSLKVSQSQLDFFSRVVDKNRFLALRILKFSINVTGENAGLDADTGNVGAVDACSRELTDVLEELLTVLYEKGADAKTHQGLELELNGRCRPFIGYKKTRDLKGGDKVEDNWVKLNPEQLPNDLKAPVVTGFSCFDNGLSWDLWPASWPALLGRFPKLAEAHLKPSDCERKDSICRREARDAFALSLRSLPATLKQLTLEYLSSPPENEFYDPPNLANLGTGYDLFSHELGVLSQQLDRLVVWEATVDFKEFFQAKPEGTWNELEELCFRNSRTGSADGSWYFNLDPRMTMEEYEEEWRDHDARTLDEMREYMEEEELPIPMDTPLEYFRTAMDPDKFRQIYTSAADATKRMPKLKRLEINFDIRQTGSGEAEHELRFFQGNERWCSASTADLRVGWNLQPMIEIDPGVVKAWKEVGAARNLTIDLLVRGDDCSDYDDFRLVDF
ncbi:hypothetical protein E8E13_003530 [Curvularia kusanoi]|uniref:DUF6546 domain-containing protein n=1 Tax=Curvularia kusanoi TaxID=90978 RepID=A0A9P4T962_CURKU|nr:hypothetical protein E8E13_003530 [Curvularia kusanoi]